MLGERFGVTWAGIVLTPEEYAGHDAYHSFYHIDRPTLFITTEPEPAYGRAEWCGVTTTRASAFAILEATDEECKALTDAGYKMMNLKQ